MTQQVNRYCVRSAVVGLVSTLLFVPASLLAGQREPLARVDASAAMVTFEPLVEQAGVRVTVTGPNGFAVVKSFTAEDLAAVPLPGVDGLYKYELRYSPVLDDESRSAMAEARSRGRDVMGASRRGEKLVQAGAFSIADGDVVANLLESENKVVLTGADGVIRNSLCVGFDCPNSPTFGDSTILMMENNTRIKFGDTSNSPFPNNDWEIEANSCLSGGANYLGFNDCGSASNAGDCATDLVFAVEAGARQSALYVESDGDIGVGTSSPVVDLHIVTGNTPTLRLDQDATSGFAPQVWDVAGNETNLFIRDVTGGSALPFRIRPGAPSNTIFLDSDGDLGIGTASPNVDAAVDILRTDAAITLLEIRNTNATPQNTGFRINNGAASGPWDFRENTVGQFTINLVGTGSLLMIDDNTTNVTIAGALITTGGGGACTAADPCDGVFSPDFKVPSIEEHADSMWQNSYLPAVGPTPENGLFNVTQKVGGILNELEKAHIYIEQLNTRLEALEKQLEMQKPQE